MSLTFANFRQVIPSSILSRGRDYMRQGQIVDLSFDEEDGSWDAQVEGSEMYDVRIEQADDGSLNCSCTCPYDMGEHCKHVAAVLYAIEEAFPDQLAIKPRKKAAKRQTRHDKLRQRLEKTSREQLVTILLELAEQDRELLNQLLIRLDNGEGKATDYRRVVKDALRVGRGEYGFLDYGGSNRAGRKVGELLTQADKWLEAGEIEKAIGVYQAVVDETVPVIAHADDSDGMLGDCINVAIEGLTACVEQQGAAGRKALFTFCLDRARRKEFYDWDWGWDLLAMAADMVENAAQRLLFMSTLEAIEADFEKAERDDFYSSYKLEQIALLKLTIIERLDGQAAARAFLQAHIHLDRLRMLLIERCIHEGQLDEATQLIQDGIKASDQRRLPGLTSQYRALRVQLFQESGDQTALIKEARALWLERADEQNFDLLKQTVAAEEWEAFVAGLIKDIRLPEQLAWLYARENRWQDLMTLMQSNERSRWLIEAYREPLELRFGDEVCKLYAQIVDTILVRASGRNHYQQAVAYLRRIKKLGQAAQVEVIAERLRKQHVNRPALLDELSRL